MLCTSKTDSIIRDFENLELREMIVHTIEDANSFERFKPIVDEN
jgi:hypothetical protein